MNQFKLHNTVTAKPIETTDLSSLLKRESHMALEQLQRIEKDGQLYVDTAILRASIGRIEDYQQRGQSFEAAIDSVAREIEHVT